MKITRDHWHGEKRYAYSKKHGWLSWFASELGACFCGWLPCNQPKHIKD